MTSISLAQKEQEKPFTIAICGGGIAGLCLAIGLQHHRVPFHLYESAHAFGEIGAGVGFGPNSVRAMHLIDPQIGISYDKIATQNGFESKEQIWFDYHAGMTCGLGKAGEWLCETRNRKGVGMSSVHRARFLDELVALVPSEKVTFGKRVVDVVESPGSEGGVKLIFEDGGEAKASAAIGCDGVKSHLRKVVLGNNATARPQFTGKYAYRGLVPMEKAVGLLGEELARNSVNWCGKDGHVLTFPVEKGKILNVVAFRTKEDGKWEDERWVLHADRATIEGDFKEWGESVKSILSMMEKPDIWALFDYYSPSKTYFKGRTCLSGDAAHASTPHHGAGAGMAIEDAYIMSRLLGSIQTSSDIEKAFKAFDAVRRPRTQKLVQTSRTAGEVYECQAEGIGDEKGAFAEDLGKRWEWIWEVDLEAHLKDAMGVLEGKA